jgi:hypothetical protein
MAAVDQLKQDRDKLSPVFASFLLVFLLGAVWYAIWPKYAAYGLLIGLFLGPTVGVWRSIVTEPTARDSSEEAAATEAAQSEKPPDRDDSKLYLEGKMQRYSLLFSVNGGVFAVVQFLKPSTLAIDIGALSVGAALFTVLMVSDIWLWGTDMRRQHGRAMFRPVGQFILLMIGALLVSGWFVAWAHRG